MRCCLNGLSKCRRGEEKGGVGAAHVAMLHRRLTEESPLRGGGDTDAVRWGEVILEPI